MRQEPEIRKGEWIVSEVGNIRQANADYPVAWFPYDSIYPTKEVAEIRAAIIKAENTNEVQLHGFNHGNTL